MWAPIGGARMNFTTGAIHVHSEHEWPFWLPNDITSLASGIFKAAPLAETLGVQELMNGE